MRQPSAKSLAATPSLLPVQVMNYQTAVELDSEDSRATTLHYGHQLWAVGKGRRDAFCPDIGTLPCSLLGRQSVLL